MKKSKATKRTSVFMFIVGLLAVVLLLTLVACDGDKTPASDVVTINFVVEGLDIPAISGKAGESITPPVDPVISGYNFKGWYLNSKHEGEAVKLPTVMPENSVTYYAKLVKLVNYKIEIYLQDIDGIELKNTYSLFDTLNGTGELDEVITADYSVENGIIVSHDGEVLSKALEADESKNVLRLYFNRKVYIVRYNKNADDATGEMESVQIPAGETVKAGTLSDCEFSRDGYRFAGWSGSASGGGDTLPTVDFVMNRNYNLYAIWDKEFTLVGERNEDLDTDKLYISSTTSVGLGKVYFVYANGERKEGFLEEGESTGGEDEIMVFSFYVDTPSMMGEEIKGEINLTQGTFRFAGKEIGTYVRYSYEFDQIFIGSASTMFEAIYLDGFGKMIYGVIDVVGGFQAVYYGTYVWNDTYSDYTFTVLNAETQKPTGEEMYFRLNGDKDIDGETLATFLVQGMESNEYYEYDIIEGGKPELLQLDGYGNARLYEIPEEADELTLISEGTYRATDLFEDEFGEWEYVADGGESFKFILTYAFLDEEVVYLYLKYNAQLDVELSPEESSSTAKLVINGYNSAMYLPNGASEEDALYGSYVMNGSENLIMTAYEGDGEDITTSEQMFIVDLVAKTFKLNDAGFIWQDDAIIGYNGSSANIEIPDGAISIGDKAFRYDNEETNPNGISLSSVTIPASVQTIGAQAFVNNYTLVRVTFLSPTPIDISWDSDSDPFRWAMEGEFKIIVPNGSEDAYRSAWTDCKYKITSLAELANKPEWETDESGKVLIAYNYNGDEAPEALELSIPDGITEIASNVFKNINYIKSIDLNNVTKLDAKAFLNCFGLESITAENLQDIGEEAFSGCESLKDARLPNIVTIGYRAFMGCYSLSHVFIGKTIQTISDYAFMHCYTDSSPNNPFMVELEDGITPFTVSGSNIFYGVESWRMSVDTVESAKLFLKNSSWTGYGYTHLWVRASESSEIAGEWVDLATMQPVTFSGRMETQSDVGYYELSEGTLTIWYYDSVFGTLKKSEGQYDEAQNKISFSISSVKYTLVKKEGKITYKKGRDTLVIDLSTYQAGWYTISDGYDTYRTTADCEFNGLPFTFSGNGSGRITIQGYVIDGLKNNVTFSLTSAMTFTYTTTVHDKRGPFAATDGSEIYVNYEGNMVYITGSLKPFVDRQGQPLVIEILGTWTCTEHDGEHFVFVFNYGIDNNKYFITADVKSDSGTFEYTYAIASSRTVLDSDSGKVIVLRDSKGDITDMQLMLPENYGDVPQQIESTYRYVEDGDYYEFTVDFMVEYFDEANQTVYYEPSPLNGTYAVIIDLNAKSCQIIKL